MKSIAGVVAALAATVSFLPTTLAQSGSATKYTDPDSGIVFDTWTVPSAQTPGGLTYGVALPPDSLKNDASEFIGYLQCSSKDANNTGWCGISFGGSMTNSLLLVAYPYKDQILTSFRWAKGYAMPEVYKGNATLTQISSSVANGKYTLTFRCQNCLQWSQDGVSGSASTSAGLMVLGWAAATPSPGNPQCPSQITMNQHDAGQGIWGAKLDSDAVNNAYSTWTTKATHTVEGTCANGTTTGIASVPVPTGASFDYIVVGGGAGGIPLADKLSEAGKKVLLIEKGYGSSGRWGGTLKPDWLVGTNLTRFDVPGLCNEIWVNSGGIACEDTDQMEGCVLGGGTAVNAGLWWKPYSLDWDYNFPAGWKSADMAAATQRVFSRIPGTDHPSQDGQRYLQQGFQVLSGGLAAGGWKNVTANDVPNEKNHTFAHTPYMFSNGERGGPMATYLVSAKARPNFSLWLNTSVKRVVREGGHVTGLEVEAFRDGGYLGTVNLTGMTGRVILSAGTFGSAKILLRSGIGPADQLAVVKNSTDGPTMIDSKSWINLPVGSNLMDHLNTDTVISHPDVVFYDFYQAWTDPNVTDKTMYLNNRTGILAQAAPNIGPMFWDEVKASDGVVRQLQWTARVEGSLGAENGNTMTMSQYLGRGVKSRGRMTITPALSTLVSDAPYLKDAGDKEVVIQGILNVQAALNKVANLTWLFPPSNQTAADYVNNMVVTWQNRRSNHWMGTAKMGTDDGRQPNGTAVVDTNAKVYGMDNLFVVDASIFPGMPSTNPSAPIVIVAERAAERILALPPPMSMPM